MRSTLQIGSVVVLLVASAAAQYIRFTDFSNLKGLVLNGPVHQATYNDQVVLRLTDGMRNTALPQATSVWFPTKQVVISGFTTYFQFQIHNPATCCNPGDGFAFVVQNSPGTSYCGSGSGTSALGVANGGMGYTGIQNSAAMEFDTKHDDWDPALNHLAVQSCGSNNPNSPVHIPGNFPICGEQYNVSSCLVDPNGIYSNEGFTLGVTCGEATCQDGALHQVVIEYTGTAENNPHNLKIYVDPPFTPNSHTPAPNAIPQINIPFNLENLVQLDQNNAAWVGFTASQASESQTQDLLYWEFTVHQQNTKIQQIIPPGGTPNTFVYGGHVFGVTYPQGFTNTDGIYMTTDAQLIDKATFYQTRLAGTQFANEQCLTYLETGGNCVVYQVTCQKNDKVTPTPCPSELTPDIAVKSSYYTADPVTAQNFDVIKAHNNMDDWCSIATSFNPNFIDPTSGGGTKDFSDIVATINTNGANSQKCYQMSIRKNN